MKKNLLIIFGGPSSEYKISLLSASSVLDNVDRNLFNIHTVGITQKGKWFYTNCSSEKIKADEWQNEPTYDTFLNTDPDKKGVLIKKDNKYIEIPIDVAFPVMHGQYGEDGVIQGLLESVFIPYVSSGIAASANCMDKAITKIILSDAKIPQAVHLTFIKNTEICDIINKTKSTFTYPVFIKPSSTGSSIGISKANSDSELEKAIKLAFTYGNKIIIEEFIVGKEIEIAVLGNNNPIASVCGEILPCNDFYDFEAKYESESQLNIPANIPNDVYLKIKDTALKAYGAVGCKCLSRIDFFVLEDNSIILNEINTIPGFTSISMYSKLFDYSNISYSGLITKLIDFAMNEN